MSSIFVRDGKILVRDGAVLSGAEGDCCCDGGGGSGGACCARECLPPCNTITETISSTVPAFATDYEWVTADWSESCVMEGRIWEDMYYGEDDAYVAFDRRIIATSTMSLPLNSPPCGCTTTYKIQYRYGSEGWKDTLAETSHPYPSLISGHTIVETTDVCSGATPAPEPAPWRCFVSPDAPECHAYDGVYHAGKACSEVVCGCGCVDVTKLKFSLSITAFGGLTFNITEADFAFDAFGVFRWFGEDLTPCGEGGGAWSENKGNAEATVQCLTPEDTGDGAYKLIFGVWVTTSCYKCFRNCTTDYVEFVFTCDEAATADWMLGGGTQAFPNIPLCFWFPADEPVTACTGSATLDVTEYNP